MKAETRGVAVDASVLINILHVARLPLLVQLPNLHVMLPEEVLLEVRRVEQRAVLETAIAAGQIERVTIDEPVVLETLAELRTWLGAGESACLALAQHRGLLVACDERKAFARLALERLGPNRVLTTADLLLQGIKAGLLSVAEADAIKEALAGLRYRMPFESFGDLLPAGPDPPRGSDDDD